jgi:hypothetical protein
MNMHDIEVRLKVIRIAAERAALWPDDDVAAYEAAYEAAYDAAVEEAQESDLPLTTDHLRTIARAAVELRQPEE